MIFEALEIRASLENPSTPLSDPAAWLQEVFGGTLTTANVRVTEKSALSVTAFWSAVATISDTLGELPIRLIRKDASGQSEEVRDHDVWSRLKYSPNTAMTSIVFKSTVQAHALTHGNGYAYIRRNRLGRPIELWPMLPQTTYPEMRDGRTMYNAQMKDGTYKLIEARNVLHIPGMSMNGVTGLSILQCQRETLGGAIAKNRYGTRLFANGAKPSGIMSFPGKIRDPESVKRQVEQATNGENAHGLMVVGGDVKYAPISLPPEDAQFLQSRDFDVDEVGRMFRLPAHFLNKMGQATFNNLEQMGTHFVRHTLQPWVTRWEQEITRKLLTRDEIADGMEFKFNVDALMRADIKTRYETYEKGINTGFLTRNEARRMEDKAPLPGLDKPIMPLNMAETGAPSAEPEPSDSGTASQRAIDSTVEMLLKNEARRVLRAGRQAKRQRKQPTDIRDSLRAFYARQSRLLRERLAISADVAAQYAEDRMQEIFSTPLDDFEQMVEDWRNEGLAEVLLEGSTDATET